MKTPDEKDIKAAIIGFYLNGAKPEFIAAKMGVDLDIVEGVIKDWTKIYGSASKTHK